MTHNLTIVDHQTAHLQQETSNLTFSSDVTQFLNHIGGAQDHRDIYIEVYISMLKTTLGMRKKTQRYREVTPGSHRHKSRRGQNRFVFNFPKS